MTDKLKIRVIKKGQPIKAVVKPQKELPTKRESARQMVSNVTSWVSDLQARKRDETKLAIEQLFASHPQPTES